MEMLKKLAAAEQEAGDLKSRVEESEELHKIDLEVALDALREDLTKAHEERMERVRQECMYHFLLHDCFKHVICLNGKYLEFFHHFGTFACQTTVPFI